MVFLKEFFKTVDFEKYQQTTKKHLKFPSRQRVYHFSSDLSSNNLLLETPVDEMLRVRGGPDTFDNLSGKTCRFLSQQTIDFRFLQFFVFPQKIQIFVSFFLLKSMLTGQGSTVSNVSGNRCESGC